MAKNKKKLSLKKETLRQLDGEQLKQVAGGTLDGYSRVVPPSFTLSCGCETTLLQAYQFNYYKYP